LSGAPGLVGVGLGGAVDEVAVGLEAGALLAGRAALVQAVQTLQTARMPVVTTATAS
jgi:hypothetical protein